MCHSKIKGLQKSQGKMEKGTHMCHSKGPTEVSGKNGKMNSCVIVKGLHKCQGKMEKGTHMCHSKGPTEVSGKNGKMNSCVIVKGLQKCQAKRNLYVSF